MESGDPVTTDFPSPDECRPIFTVRRPACWSEGSLDGTLTVVNDSSCTFEGATAEILLEVERGVLITWKALLKPLVANSTIDDAVLETTPPDLTLPSNVDPGHGTITVTLRDQQGRFLGRGGAEVEVTAPP
jgi:hypothetical protein